MCVSEVFLLLVRHILIGSDKSIDTGLVEPEWLAVQSVLATVLELGNDEVKTH